MKKLGLIIRRTLEMRDYIIFRLEGGHPINNSYLVRRFGLSERQARRYWAIIVSHCGLDIEYISPERTFRLRRPPTR